VAAQHPEVLAKMMQLATDAHRPPEPGEVLDPTVGFKGHDED
jgi:hypothetical protein